MRPTRVLSLFNVGHLMMTTIGLMMTTTRVLTNTMIRLMTSQGVTITNDGTQTYIQKIDDTHIVFHPSRN